MNICSTQIIQLRRESTKTESCQLTFTRNTLSCLREIKTKTNESNFHPYTISRSTMTC